MATHRVKTFCLMFQTPFESTIALKNVANTRAQKHSIFGLKYRVLKNARTSVSKLNFCRLELQGKEKHQKPVWRWWKVNTRGQWQRDPGREHLCRVSMSAETPGFVKESSAQCGSAKSSYMGRLDVGRFGNYLFSAYVVYACCVRLSKPSESTCKIENDTRYCQGFRRRRALRRSKELPLL